VLSFREHPDPARPRTIEAGPWAIEEYLEDPLDTRFIQSFKSFAASPHFQSTEIFGRRYAFDDLLWAFLARLRLHAGDRLQDLPETVVIGRPVQFAGASPDADLALQRYEQAFRRLGFKDLHYVYEPVAAAFYFAERLSGGAAVLVADFGGGTSDFSVIRFDRQGGRVVSRALSHSGVAVAGDAFDYRIIDHVVCPLIGKGGAYRSAEKLLPIPNHYYANFARWHSLCLMKTPRVLRALRELARDAVDGDGLDLLVAILEEDLVYQLYRAVAEVKIRLSEQESAAFVFDAPGRTIRTEVTRRQFDSWIAGDVERISEAVDRALAEARLAAGDIDQVFLTGGTSFVPAVRDLFLSRFGQSRIESGNQFDSIASGLALIACEESMEQWCVG
jgi:hypothetical chaperone protein